MTVDAVSRRRHGLYPSLYSGAIMGRRLIATLASLILLCAAVLALASALRGPSTLASVSLVAAINTADGVSLDESVMDDLRPSALQDAPSSGGLIDQLPTSAWPAWGMANCTAAWVRSGMPPPLPWPCLGSPLRPPSAA